MISLLFVLQMVCYDCFQQCAGGKTVDMSHCHQMFTQVMDDERCGPSCETEYNPLDAFLFNSQDSDLVPMPNVRPDAPGGDRTKARPNDSSDIEAGGNENFRELSHEDSVLKPLSLNASDDLYVGKDVFTIAEIHCRKSSNFLRGWWSKVSAASEGNYQATAREHLAITNNTDLVDNDGNPDTQSVHYGDFWCVPKRAWCYKTLSEGAFGSNQLLGSTYDLDLAVTAVVETKLVNTFKHIIHGACEEEQR